MEHPANKPETMNVTLYHNPRCSKSRAALALLEAQGIAPKIILYLEQPPAATTLKHLLHLLGKTPRELMRHGEAIYRELNLDDPALTETQLIEAMTMHPTLIERPIAVVEDGGETRAIIGRPPEAILDILER